jgi:hypothetical protein
LGATQTSTAATVAYNTAITKMEDEEVTGATQRYSGKRPCFPYSAVNGVPDHVAAPPMGLAPVCKPCFLHHSSRGAIGRISDADDALQPKLLKPVAQARQTAAPIRAGEQPAYLTLVLTLGSVVVV